MRLRKLHSWDLTPREAMDLQKTLRSKIILEDRLTPLRYIAGADIAYSRHSLRGQPQGRTFGAVAVFTYPELQLIEESKVCDDTTFPYVPGLLTFREGPVILKAFRNLKQAPDLILFDGQGIAHPRGFGLASHMGLIINKPSIGCAKSHLYGRCTEPGKKRGDHSPILDENGAVIGALLRTRDRVAPVYVSQGHKVSLTTTIEIVLSCCRGYRIPQPIRHVHQLVTGLRKETETQNEDALW